jgi:hypothetical protein
LLHYTKLSAAEQLELLTRASSKTKISPLLIEKDFWVVFLLNQIFNSPLSNELTFKGGTSLSKCFGLISRFSEDIDLTIDSSIFNNTLENITLSGKEQKRLLQQNNDSGIHYINEKFIPILTKQLENAMIDTKWEFKIDEHEPKNIRFFYPSVVTLSNDYIKNSILLELGVRGRISPFVFCTISSLVEDNNLEVLEKQKPSTIRTLSFIRTFWEKITILHAENHRKSGMTGDRLSRHYYDVYQMIINGISKDGLKHIDILNDVIENKKTNFRCAWAEYEKAVPGTLNIFPNKNLIDYLKNDYKKMDFMIFDKKPSFEDIMNAIETFQKEFNNSDEKSS